MTHCDNLVEVHRGHGGPAQGRRAQETSLNRAVVVVTVAAWQSAVQDMATCALDAGSPGPGSSISPQTYAVVAGQARTQIGNFSTPNPENTKRLLRGVGFDPRPLWTWQQSGGQGVGFVTIHPTEAERRMAGWLRLRHDIAHGADSLSQVDVLQAVRQAQNPQPDWGPSIRLVDAEACMTFFRRLANLTGTGLAGWAGQLATRWDRKA